MYSPKRIKNILRKQEYVEEKMGNSSFNFFHWIEIQWRYVESLYKTIPFLSLDTRWDIFYTWWTRSHIKRNFPSTIVVYQLEKRIRNLIEVGPLLKIFEFISD